jgi:hypothetical protein
VSVASDATVLSSWLILIASQSLRTPRLCNMMTLKNLGDRSGHSPAMLLSMWELESKKDAISLRFEL